MPIEARTAPMSMIGRIQMDVLPSKKTVQTASDPNAPIMKTSPWAKLMSWTMP